MTTKPPIEDKLLHTLKKYWGYDSFRELQREAIESVMAGRDTIAMLPTGGGKSILYQLPTLAQDGLCIVITPLISLMKDQVDRLRRLNINAVAVHSGMTARQIDYALDNCAYGNVRFLYIAPERIATEIFRMRLRKMTISLIAIDEAHCISQWGYDFRPAYLKIATIRALLPDVPMMALTASATQGVVEDIALHLQFKNHAIIKGTFARPNISYAVRLCEDRKGQLLRLLERVDGCGIIYVRMRETAQTLARELSEDGIMAEFYHGGLPHAIREQKQERWTKGECRVMVATNAFGMGIDKADVRFVVHWDTCSSIEAYYQEAGRAGRDGVRSYALLMLSPDDKSRANQRFETEFPSIDKIKECYEALCNYLQVGIGDGKFATYAFDMFEFCQRHKLFGPTADNAMKVLQQNGYIHMTEELKNPPRMIFTVSRDDLYRLRIDNNQYDHLLRVVLRLYSGLFSDFVPIDESEIAATAGYTKEHVKELLRGLWLLRVIKYIPSNHTPLVMFIVERVPTQDLYISVEQYERRKRSTRERLEAMFAYADNLSECRSRLISSYFGEEIDDCGVCDICMLKRKRTKIDIAARVMELLLEGVGEIKSLVNGVDAPSEEVIRVIDKMLEREDIFADKMGRLNIKR